MTHIEQAFRIISAMTVNGDNQDLVVAAKNELRAAILEQRAAGKEDSHGQADNRPDGGKSDQQS